MGRLRPFARVPVFLGWEDSVTMAYIAAASMTTRVAQGRRIGASRLARAIPQRARP